MISLKIVCTHNNVHFHENCENLVFVNKTYRLGETCALLDIICPNRVNLLWCIYEN